MRRIISMMVLALLAISATAQTTDRLSASSVLHYSSRGFESDKDLIEIFRYEAQLEGKRWHFSRQVSSSPMTGGHIGQ